MCVMCELDVRGSGMRGVGDICGDAWSREAEWPGDVRGRRGDGWRWDTEGVELCARSAWREVRRMRGGTCLSW